MALNKPGTAQTQQEQIPLLVRTVDRLVLAEQQRYADQIKLMGGKGKLIQQIIKELDAQKLVDSDPGVRTAEINKMNGINGIIKDRVETDTLSEITRRVTVLSAIRGRIDGIFEQHMETLLGNKGGGADQRQAVKDHMRAVLRSRLYDNLFPDMSGKPIIHKKLDMDARVNVRRQEQELLRQIQEIKDIPGGRHVVAMRVAKTEEKFFQTLRDIAGMPKFEHYTGIN